jgi:hypothetical protein
MRNSFPGYYKPKDEDFEQLWNEAILAFDANVLLNLYRYSEGTREEFFKILTKLQSRLWLPHQAAFEYHKNRLSVISSLEGAYEKLTETISDFENKFLNSLNGFSRHPLIEVEAITDEIKKTISGVKKRLSDTKAAHPDLAVDDHVRDRVTQLFEKKVGAPYTEEQLKKVYLEGKNRYEKSVPPGYKDEHKDDESKYGDLVVWKQIIDKAKESETSIMFVTDDRKEDWWERFKGKVIRPRPELIQEICEQTGVKFYMYQTDPFMEQASKHLRRKVKQNAIDEVKNIRNYYDSLASIQLSAQAGQLTEQLLMMNKKYEDILKPIDFDSMRNIYEKSISEGALTRLSEQFKDRQLGLGAEELIKLNKRLQGGLLGYYEAGEEGRNE